MTVFNGNAFFEGTLRGRFRELKKTTVAGNGVLDSGLEISEDEL